MHVQEIRNDFNHFNKIVGACSLLKFCARDLESFQHINKSYILKSQLISFILYLKSILQTGEECSFMEILKCVFLSMSSSISMFYFRIFSETCLTTCFNHGSMHIIGFLQGRSLSAESNSW